jgi:hypothetical protein
LKAPGGYQYQVGRHSRAIEKTVAQHPFAVGHWTRRRWQQRRQFGLHPCSHLGAGALLLLAVGGGRPGLQRLALGFFLFKTRRLGIERTPLQ